MSSKVYVNAASALDGVLFNGMAVMAGGFGLCGIPEHLITALRDSGVKNGHGVVDLLITDLGVFEIDSKDSRAGLIELAPGVTVDEVRARTEANFDLAIRA